MDARRSTAASGLARAAAGQVTERCRQGDAVSPEKVAVKVDGRTLALTNLDKVLYPETGFTKGEIIDYYTRVSPVLLPHVIDRPITFKRYPEGVEGQSFFAKNA